MAVKMILLGACAALVAAVPKHAEHIGNAQIARSNQLFARSELSDRAISWDGSCGSWSGNTCPGSTCCSSYGWCGSSDAYCGVGCQAGFGQCGSSDQSPVVSPASEPTTTSTTSSTTSTTVASLPTDLPVVQTADSGQQPAYQPITTTSAASTPTTTAQSAATTASTNSGLGDSYKMYTGDGSLATGWPAQTEWVDFDTAFENNRGLLSQSCAQFGAANNDDNEINNLKSALQSVAASTGVDDRFLLAIVMQESGGCVRAPTTNYGVRNPGLFQSHDGTGTCNDSGNVQNECPMSEITQMVTDGAAGTAKGDGLKQTIAEAGTSDVSKYYRAARIYNSGSIAASGQLQDGIATHCYSSDVANRLTGWVHAAHGCSA